jgi:hypothetical protein
MQFSDQMWEEIRKLKIGGVTWELLPDMPPPKIDPQREAIQEYEKVNHKIHFIPDEIPEPVLAKSQEPVVVKETKTETVSFVSQKVPMEKKPRAKQQRSTRKSVSNETTTVRKRRPASKRV